ncbi:MAG: PilZ domain-containing protein [Syntrophobacteraceae bacterium]|nr:PilZ domain-containing protein [Syntrophobacteraceae bacterium]
MSEQESRVAREGVQERRAPCLVTFSFDEKVGRGSSIHFSERGILVLCQEPAPLNARLKLVLQFPGLRNPVEAQGDVVWTNIHGPADSLSPRGMGIKFSQMDRDVERLLAEMSGHYEGSAISYGCYYT